MQLLTLNAAGKPLAPPARLDPRRRRLSQVIGRHVDRSRPHMIAVQRARDPLQPIEEAWVLRGRDKHGKVKPWPRTYLPADAVVVVVYLPRGGAMGGGGSRGGKSPLGIALGIAGLALVAFAGPLGNAAAGALSLGGAGSFAAAALTAGIAVGGAALLGLASRSKANKPATDTTQIYGVAGGGNLPKPGDRIPRGYGRSWMKPDLSQPDFSQYDGDDQILFKRHTLGLGRYRPYRVRAGKQVIWTEAGGFQAPFNDARNAIQFVYGTPSTLVPSNVVSASGIGGLLPRPADVPSIAGPFLINQRGALVSRLQVDFQFPQGISRTETLRSGTVRSNQPGAWSVVFQYAPIDESGAITGPWQELYYGNSGAEGARFATHPLRYTKFRDVPAGRYAVRGWNVQPDSTGDPNNATIDAAQWDAASGWVSDAAIRPGVTEMALRIYATKGSQAAAFGEVEIDAAAIIPVWTGSAWEEQETSKAVWAFVDILRNQDYGGGLPGDQIDVERARGYAFALTEFDTFDGTIRGPVSVYEAAATVLLPLRAEPVHTGRYWSLVRDEPKAVRRHVVTRRQILKGTSEISFDLDTAAGAGHVIGEFDQDGDYRNPNQTTAIYGEASLTPTRQRWTGVRTFAHAQHLTRWRAASGAYRRQSTPFGVEMEGRIYRRGDSISVDHWFVDTAFVAGVLARNGNDLLLDASQQIPAGSVAVLRDRTGREWGPVGFVASPDGRTLALDPAGVAQVEAATGLPLAAVLTDGRADMTTVRMGPLEVLSENYLIQSVKMSGSDRAQVEALIDDARVWNAIGAPIVVPPAGGGGLSDPESPSILGLTANAVPIAAGFRCDYAIRPGRGAVRFEVGISYDGTRFDARPDAPVTGSIDLNPVDPQSITVRARAFGATGLPGPYYYTLLDLGRAYLNAALDPIDYTGLTTDVQARIAHILDVEAQANAQAADLLARVLAAAGVGDANTAAIISESQTRLQGDQALATDLSVVVARVGSAEAAVLTERTARISGDQALATDLSAVVSRVGSTEAAVATERSARIDGDSAQATRTDLLVVQTDSDRSYFLGTTNALIDGQGATTTRLDVLSATVNFNTGTIVAEQLARANGDSAQASRTDALIAQTNSDRAYFLGTTNALADAAGASASQINDLYARSDAGTAVGRFSMQVASGPGGVTARIQALVAATRGGQTYGAGYYIDLLDSGQSRFVVDADAFYITKGGSSVPLLSFDGTTLTIPVLRVTQGIIAPNAAADKVIQTVENFTADGSAGVWREVPGSAVIVDVDTAPGFGITFNVTSDLYAKAVGSNATYVAVDFRIAFAINGNIYNGRAVNAVSIGGGGGVPNINEKSTGRISSTDFEVLPPGQQRISLHYFYQAGSAECVGRITFGQIKALISKR